MSMMNNISNSNIISSINMKKGSVIRLKGIIALIK